MTDVAPIPPRPVGKRRFGCLAWGALVLILLVVGFFVLVVIGYGRVAWMKGVSDDSPLYSATPTDPLAWISGAATGNEALNDFQTKLQNNQSAALQLTAGEINTLLGSLYQLNNVGLVTLFTFTGNEGEVEVSVATDSISSGTVKGRYFNLDMTFEPGFDSAKKEIRIIPHSVKFVVPTGQLPSGATQMDGVPLDPSHVPEVMKIINVNLNQALRGDDTGKLILEHTTSIRIEDSQLIIQAQ